MAVSRELAFFACLCLSLALAPACSGSTTTLPGDDDGGESDESGNDDDEDGDGQPDGDDASGDQDESSEGEDADREDGSDQEDRDGADEPDSADAADDDRDASDDLDAGEDNADSADDSHDSDQADDSDDTDAGDDRDGNDDGVTEPGPDDPADGPAGSALLASVWNQPFTFEARNYPLTWSISVVHASMLYRAAGIPYSPSAVLSIAIKESKLSCLNPDPQDAQQTMAVKDGCFQIEAESAYLELKALFPERFAADHADVIAAKHFESSAIASVYYALFSMARFRDFGAQPGDPQMFFDDHDDPQAAQKVLCAAYNRGLWWPALKDIFSTCRKGDVTRCFSGMSVGIAIDHANYIAEYTRTLDAAEPFDTQLDAADLSAYWQSIRALYPDADDAKVRAALNESFDELRGGQSTISFHKRIRQVLSVLIKALPPAPSQSDVAALLCEQHKLTACD